MFNRRISKRLSESVRQELEHQADIDRSLNRYQRRDISAQQTIDSFGKTQSNPKQRSRSRIAAGFNPETGQVYAISSSDSSQVQESPRSRLQSNETTRKYATSSDEEEQQQFGLPASTEEIQEEFDADEEVELQYPTQAYLTGENLLEEYSEELNISSSNNIRSSQQSQQRIGIPASPQLSKHPFGTSQKYPSFNPLFQDLSVRVSPLIPTSRLSTSGPAQQSQPSPFKPEQNSQFQGIQSNMFPVVSGTKPNSRQILDKQATKRSQKVVQNSSVNNSMIMVASDKQQEQERDISYSNLDTVENQIYDESDQYRASNSASKYDQQPPQQPQVQPLKLTRIMSHRNSQSSASAPLPQREKPTNRSSRIPSRLMGVSDEAYSDSDQDGEYQTRDSNDGINSKLCEEQGANLSYAPSMISRPNSNYSLTNQVHLQKTHQASRDVIPLPIEIPESVTDADAFRRYLSRGAVESLGRDSIIGSRVGSQQMGSINDQFVPISATSVSLSRMQDSQQQQQLQFQQSQGQGQPSQSPCFSSGQNPENYPAKYHTRTASLSHAIMTLALLSASAAQLRFVVAYSHAHSYPTLNYFLICSCIIIEVLVGIGFVVLARFDFSEAFQDKLHSYLIFGLFVVTVANVIVAAFALDDHICEVLMKRSLSSIDPQFQLDNTQLQLGGLGPM